MGIFLGLLDTINACNYRAKSCVQI